ncbi:hypothetical protein PACTADRAFT_52058 [Pachysolen tannophilus NRRL Y-2460]|uniref:Kinase n=1 Tax=Pachysolen tannophilus NRRL Y-2460 TaxID=669874 RepID=A0A1E4TP12_PACTA|nr:hypothetical protein PACTADRAFT_52058 [Pachysolen tannophilus NRRL Y-2460]
MDSLTELNHQAAGHPDCMQTVDGSLFAKLTTQQEIDFYNAFQQERQGEIEEEIDDERIRLQDWMPVYIGNLVCGVTKELEQTGQVDEKILKAARDVEPVMNNLQQGNDNKQYILLENLLYGYNKPSILDIKLGSKLYDSFASDSKRQRLEKVSQETTSGSLNFRICGMKILSNEIPQITLQSNIPINEVIEIDNSGQDTYLAFNKYFGRGLTKDTIKDGLKIFFLNNNLEHMIQKKILQNFHTRLILLYNCLLEEKIESISSSLLFIFENDIQRWKSLDYNDPVMADSPFLNEQEEEEEEDTQEETNRQLSRLALIDFAHSKKLDPTDPRKYDENIVKGIHSLIETISEILDEIS